MLFAYAVSGDTTLTAADIRELSQAIATIGEEHLPAELSLGLDTNSLVPGTRVQGVFLRGYEQVFTKGEAMWMVQALRALSARFPTYAIFLSGWGELPMTELRGGEFGMFAETYQRALTEFAVTQRAMGRRQARAH